MARTKNPTPIPVHNPSVEDSRAAIAAGKMPQETCPEVPKPTRKRGRKQAEENPVEPECVDVPSKKGTRKPPTVKMEYLEIDGHNIKLERYNLCPPFFNGLVPILDQLVKD